MKKLLFVTLLTLDTLSCFAQQEKIDTAKKNGSDEKSYIEVAPSTPYNLTDYFNQNLKYPRDAQDAGITGKVVLKFVINEDGKVSDVAVMKGVSPSIDAEAKRLMEQMPPWKPGTSNGKPVKVYFTMPINFSYEDTPFKWKRRKHKKHEE